MLRSLIDTAKNVWVFFSCYPTCVLTNKVVDINTIINYYYNKQKKQHKKQNKTKKTHTHDLNANLIINIITVLSKSTQY